MKEVQNLFNKFTQSSPGAQLAILGLIALWTLIFVLIIFGIFFVSLERSSRAEGIMLTPATPAIMVEPSTGSVGTLVTIQGQGWPVGSTVMVYLAISSQAELPDYAIASLVVDQHGQFVAEFVVPAEPHWEDQSQATIIAWADNGVTAKANFKLIPPTPQPTESPTASEPTATPTSLDQELTRIIRLLRISDHADHLDLG